MNQYAQIIDNVIVNVVIADPDWIAQQPGIWAAYDNDRPAGIGWTWDSDAQRAIAPKPFPSWTLDDDYRWQAPVPYPTDGGIYYWDEETGTWLSR